MEKIPAKLNPKKSVSKKVMKGNQYLSHKAEEKEKQIGSTTQEMGPEGKAEGS